MASPKPIPRPTVATEIPAKRDSGVERGPNPYLEPDLEGGAPNGWFMQSYETGKWMDIGPVSGAWVASEITKGERKGETVDRLEGDAMLVTRQLRDAANQLGLGVSIKYWEVYYKSGPKKGEPVPGQMVVKYLAQNRKQRRESTQDSTGE